VYEGQNGEDEGEDVQVGDVIVGIDGLDVKDRLEWLSKLFSSSTKHSCTLRLMSLLLAGPEGTNIDVTIKRKNKDTPGTSEKTIKLKRVALPQSLRGMPPTKDQTYELLSKLDKTGKQIGYLDLRTLAPSQTELALNHIKSTNNLIIDLRGYTKGTMNRLARYFIKKRVVVSQSQVPFFMPSLLVDGIEPSVNVSYQAITPGDSLEYYNGSITALIDSSTISLGEHSALVLKVCRPDTIFVGCPTAGALGNVTNIILPGNVEVGFTAIGYTTVDGKNVQNGIEPDIYVRETVDGTIKGIDEILIAAIEHIQHK